MLSYSIIRRNIFRKKGKYFFNLFLDLNREFLVTIMKILAILGSRASCCDYLHFFMREKNKRTN